MPPPDLTQLETVDEGNEGGEEEGRGETVRIRDIEGEEDLACQFLHPCDKPVEMWERTAFWKRGRTTIFDVQICDTDAKRYGNCTPKKVLESAALKKKSKYEETCLEWHRYFTPMLYSVNGMADKQACAAEKWITGIPAGKWTRQYSQMACFIRTRMCLAIFDQTPSS